jgi:hypothetical protein
MKIVLIKKYVTENLSLLAHDACRLVHFYPWAMDTSLSTSNLLCFVSGFLGKKKGKKKELGLNVRNEYSPTVQQGSLNLGAVTLALRYVTLRYVKLEVSLEQLVFVTLLIVGLHVQLVAATIFCEVTSLYSF